MDLIAGDSPERAKAVAHMAKASGTDVDGFERQLSTTYLFDTPKAALTFVSSAELPKTMDKVASFSFDHGLLGEGAKDSKAVGMSFANDAIVGNPGNLKLRFDPTYVRMAVDGSL